MVSHLVIQNLFQIDKTLKFHETEGLYFLRGEGGSQEEQCLIMCVMNQTIELSFYPVAIKMVDCQFHHPAFQLFVCLHLSDNCVA